MINKKIPHFIIKKNLQKSKQTGKYFSDDLTEQVLKDICIKLTSKSKYTIQFVDNDYEDEFQEKGYNKGRIAILLYDDYVNYISFSESGINGRNSSVQSVPTAFNLFYNSKIKNKHLYYYFLESEGNYETDYHLFMYRLMSTIGFEFINDDVLDNEIIPFNSIDDIIHTRKSNKGKNKSNNSTYVTKSTKFSVDIYGKTYGASKYESAMICYALSKLASKKQTVTLYEVLEQDLKELPKRTRKTIEKMGVINIIPTDMILEKKVFDETNSLRSPRYLYNLLNKFGEKKCALCDCIVPESIQGAHIWPVSEIKNDKLSNFDQKLEWAIDGENGLWLCNNHHIWFDKNIIRISPSGDILIDDTIDGSEKEFIEKTTTVGKLPKEYLTKGFVTYIRKRYQLE